MENKFSLSQEQKITYEISKLQVENKILEVKVKANDNLLSLIEQHEAKKSELQVNELKTQSESDITILKALYEKQELLRTDVFKLGRQISQMETDALCENGDYSTPALKEEKSKLEADIDSIDTKISLLVSAGQQIAKELLDMQLESTRLAQEIDAAKCDQQFFVSTGEIVKLGEFVAHRDVFLNSKTTELQTNLSQLAAADAAKFDSFEQILRQLNDKGLSYLLNMMEGMLKAPPKIMDGEITKWAKQNLEIEVKGLETHLDRAAAAAQDSNAIIKVDIYAAITRISNATKANTPFQACEDLQNFSNSLDHNGFDARQVLWFEQLKQYITLSHIPLSQVIYH